MFRKTSLVRKFTLAAITTTLVAVWPGVAHAALVGDWQMTDVGAPPPTMTDSSGNHNDGSPSGGVVGDGDVFTFDGTGVAIVPDGGALDPGTADITITAVISYKALPGHDYDIVRKKPAGVKGMQYRMEIMYTGKAKCFFTGDTGNSAITSSPVPSDGKSHTIVCTKTASTIGVAVDGVARTKIVTIGSISNHYAISIGAKASGGDYFVGSIDAVRIDYT
jgi:Concanavalin A-like lectin/glucanases superfamily